MGPLGFSARLGALMTVALLAGTIAQAQIDTINSAFVKTREFNDVPGAVVTTFMTYPSLVFFGESGVSAATGFANRDVWRFSNNGGTSAYQFQDNEYFKLQLDLTLIGSPTSPRKEAGILFTTASSGDVQFIVNTDGHEVVQFGGISFYSFNNAATNAVRYDSGDQIKLGLSYFLSQNGKNALQFSANGVESPIFEFPAGGGIGNGSTLGGYVQIVNDPGNPGNSGSAIFSNIELVPEPSVSALVGLGCLALIVFRRRGSIQ